MSLGKLHLQHSYRTGRGETVKDFFVPCLEQAVHLGQIPRVPPPRCHELTGDRQGQLSVDLDHPYRLFFIPANDPVPRKEDGGLDWSAVTEIEMIEIADPH